MERRQCYLNKVDCNFCVLHTSETCSPRDHPLNVSASLSCTNTRMSEDYIEFTGKGGSRSPSAGSDSEQSSDRVRS